MIVIREYIQRKRQTYLVRIEVECRTFTRQLEDITQSRIFVNALQ